MNPNKHPQLLDIVNGDRRMKERENVQARNKDIYLSFYRECIGVAFAHELRRMDDERDADSEEGPILDTPKITALAEAMAVNAVKRIGVNITIQTADHE